MKITGTNYINVQHGRITYDEEKRNGCIGEVTRMRDYVSRGKTPYPIHRYEFYNSKSDFLSLNDWKFKITEAKMVFDHTQLYGSYTLHKCKVISPSAEVLEFDCGSARQEMILNYLTQFFELSTFTSFKEYLQYKNEVEKKKDFSLYLKIKKIS